SLIVGKNDTSVKLSAEKPVAVKLEDQEAKAPRMLQRFRLGDEDSINMRATLHLNNISSTAPPSVGYDVFLGLKEGEVASYKSPHFVGMIVLFGIQQSNHHAGKPKVF